MPGDWDKNVHPDLVEDVPAEASTAAELADAPETPDSAAGEDTTPSEPQAPTESLEWFEQVRDAKDPAEALRLLAKNLPRDQFEKDEVVSGLLGQMGDRRARALLQQQEREATERAKLEAAQNNDLYTLGEMTQRELQGQLASQQAAQAAGPFMDGVVAFQKQPAGGHPEGDFWQSVRPGKDLRRGRGRIHGVHRRPAVKLEAQKRESAIRKSVMSEINGDEPVPERDSGTPGRVREVTDEMIAAMSLREYEALFDENGRQSQGCAIGQPEESPFINIRGLRQVATGLTEFVDKTISDGVFSPETH